MGTNLNIVLSALTVVILGIGASEGCSGAHGPKESARSIAVLQRATMGERGLWVTTPVAIAYSDGTVLRRKNMEDTPAMYLLGKFTKAQSDELVRYIDELLSDSADARQYASWRDDARQNWGCYFVRASERTARLVVNAIGGKSGPFDSIPRPLIGIGSILLNATLEDVTDWAPNSKELQFSASALQDSLYLKQMLKQTSMYQVTNWPLDWPITDSLSYSDNRVAVLCTELPLKRADSISRTQRILFTKQEVLVRDGRILSFFKSRYVFPDDHLWKSECEMNRAIY